MNHKTYIYFAPFILALFLVSNYSKVNGVGTTVISINNDDKHVMAAISMLKSLQNYANLNGMSKAVPVGTLKRAVFNSELGGWQNVTSLQIVSSQIFVDKNHYWRVNLNVSLKSETEALESRFERWDFWQSQRPFALGTA